MIIRAGTLPYYRIFHFNTLDPVLRMAGASKCDKPRVLLKLVSRWRSQKVLELQFVSLACTVLAAAVIGSFSWSSVSDAYWLALAFWYSTLFFSIIGILLSAQQLAVLNLLGDLPPTYSSRSAESAKAKLRRYLPLMLSEQRPHPKDEETETGSRQEKTKTRTGLTLGIWSPRWKMVFTWQCATMFMSYSLIGFLMGLTLLVCTPLIRGGEWDVDKSVAVVYLSLSGVAGLVFVFCSFWAYHYVDLEHDDSELDDKDEVISRVPTDTLLNLHSTTMANRLATGSLDIATASSRDVEEP